MIFSISVSFTCINTLVPTYKSQRKLIKFSTLLDTIFLNLYIYKFGPLEILCRKDTESLGCEDSSNNTTTTTNLLLCLNQVSHVMFHISHVTCHACPCPWPVTCHQLQHPQQQTPHLQTTPKQGVAPELNLDQSTIICKDPKFYHFWDKITNLSPMLFH